MPYRVFNLDEVARYLHLTQADVELLVKNQEIPFSKRGDRLVFQRREIDAWASQRILGLQDRSLARYHQQSADDTRELFPSEAVLAEMMHSRWIDPAVRAKTRASVIRHMVSLAEGTGRVNDMSGLLTSLEEREGLCSTGLPGGLALLHPRHHDPYMFESSFIALGRTLQEIHFGAPDGQPTDLFFLICCQDDRVHLHTLARLCLLAQRTDLLTRLRQAPDSAAMYDCIVASEATVIGEKR